MESRENHAWTPIPEFGKWDQKSGGNPNYSVVFSQARANRKQAKNDMNRLSLGCHEDLIAHTKRHTPRPQHHGDSATGRKKFRAFFTSCIRPRFT
ncbi:hypothetical protein AKJ16_DCAP17279 [Drosera capensis]